MVVELEFSDGICYYVITAGDPQACGGLNSWVLAGPVLPKQEQPWTGLPSQPPPGGDVFSLKLEISLGL